MSTSIPDEEKFVCVECAHPTKELYLQSSGQVVALSTCEECGHVVDPYIEYEVLLLFIDLLLHKRQVWYHLLVNRWPHHDNQFSLAFHCLRLTSAVIFLDACVHKIVHGWTFNELGDSNILQFLLIEWLVYILLMLVIVHVFLYLQSGAQSLAVALPGGKVRLVAGFTLASAWKVGALPLLVWQPENPAMQVWSLQLFCLASQALALQAFLTPRTTSRWLDYFPAIPIRGILALLPLVLFRAYWRSRLAPLLTGC